MSVDSAGDDTFTPLIDSRRLAAHLGDPRWVVFDCRYSLTDPGAGRRAYAQGHIPGARYACHNLLAMHIAGLRGSRLYPGSWSEWIRDCRRPIARGE